MALCNEMQNIRALTVEQQIKMGPRAFSQKRPIWKQIADQGGSLRSLDAKRGLPQLRRCAFDVRIIEFKTRAFQSLADVVNRDALREDTFSLIWSTSKVFEGASNSGKYCPWDFSWFSKAM